MKIFRKQTVIKTMNKIIHENSHVDKFYLSYTDYLKFQMECKLIINIKAKKTINSYCGIPIDFFNCATNNESKYFIYGHEYILNNN